MEADLLFLKNLCALIEKKLGIFLSKEKAELHLSTLFRKSKLINRLGYFEYLKLLESTVYQDEPEWGVILDSLNISETYFYRDKNQILLLDSVILPKLILKNSTTKSISIWSAGCSSGEEAYTIAFLLKSLVSSDWKIRILGTDLNSESVGRAKRGIYNEWSLRSLPENYKNLYFKFQNKEYSVRDELKINTNFKLENILSSTYSEEFDLVICRNVFIYLSEEAKKIALEKFANSLFSEGFLLLGHSEAGFHLPSVLNSQVHSNLIYYQKKTDHRFLNSEEFFRTKSLTFIPDSTKQVTPTQKQISDKEVFSLQRATEYANSGNLESALKECKSILEKQPNNWEVIYFIGHIYEAESRYVEAEKTYQKAIQLKRGFMEAYLSLASLYQTLGRNSESKAIKSKALKELEDKEIQDYYKAKGKNIDEFKTFLLDEQSIWIS